MELLPRLRDATSGSITYDGTDIEAFDVGTLRRGIGYLTQNAMLFNDTVRENLVYGLGFEPSDEQIRDALEGAHAGFVYDLPQGLETMLGDRGVRFSGGEQQRIALARVLLEDTSIIDPRRTDQRAGLRVREVHPGRARQAARAQDDHRHRAPSRDRHPGRPAPGHRGRPHRGARDARGARGSGGRVPEALPEPAAGLGDELPVQAQVAVDHALDGELLLDPARAGSGEGA